MQVSRRQALQWCERIGAQYFEGSAKEDVDVDKAFMSAAQAGLQQVTQSKLTLIKLRKTTSIYV